MTRLIRLLLCVLPLFPVLQTSAEETTLESLLREADENNPQLHAAISKAQGADARPAQEGALPDPMIGFMSTNMSSPIPFTEIGKDPQANAGVVISQEIPFPGKRALKEQVALKEAQGEWQEAAATRLRIRNELKGGYYELRFLDTAREILTKSRESLQRIAQVAQSQYEVGQTAQQDILRAQVEVAIVDGRLLAIEQKRRSAVAQMNSFLNRQPGTPLESLRDPGLPAVAASFDSLKSALNDGNPMLKAKKHGVERNLLDLDARRRDYYPDFNVGGYYGYSGDLPDMWQLRVDLKVPLYFWKKQRNAVVESQSRVSQSRKEEDAAAQELFAALEAAFAQAKAAEKLITLYDQSIIRNAHLAVESSLQGYQTGKVDFLTILSNLVTERDYQLSYAEEVMNLRKAAARIDEITAADGM